MVGGWRLQLFVVCRGHCSGQLDEGRVLVETAGHVLSILPGLTSVQQEAEDGGQLRVLSGGCEDSDLHVHGLEQPGGRPAVVAEAGESRGNMVASCESRNDEDLRNLSTGSEVTGEDIRVNNSLKIPR